jgi:hypothetical protein
MNWYLVCTLFLPHIIYIYKDTHEESPEDCPRLLMVEDQNDK